MNMKNTGDALLRQALEALERAHQTAMEQTLRARVPECAEFAGIAQDLGFVAAALKQPTEGEEIMVNTPHNVFTLPLHPSGLSSGPRFVVHVPDLQRERLNKKEQE